MVGVESHLEYAHTGNSAGRAFGRTHLVVDGALEVGRLRREAGDALCRARSKFWGLYDDRGADVSSEITCSVCAKRYQRMVESGAIKRHEGKTRRAE